VQVILRGTGVTPAISLNPKTLDFGSVLHGAYRDLSSYLVNTGNATAHFTLSTTAPEFQISGPDSLTPGSADSIHVRFTPGTSTSQITALGLISYDELQDTLQLMGIGSDRGLQISSLESDFGDVHVDRDSVTRIALTAVEDPATIESISGIPPTSSFSITDTVSSFPHVVKVGDTVWLDITYRPTVEQSDAATVAILTDKGQSSIALRGAGVSEHIAVNATAIDIGDVELGNSETVPKITLTNTGSYPLTLLGATTRIFAISPSLNGVEIPPGGLMTLDITFAPTRARRYVDTLAILSSAPEGPRFVLLTGRGVYPIATRPKFSYVVGSVDLRSGDQVNIPVSIAGSFIDHLDADSTVLQLSFDPTMMRVRGVTSSSLRSWEVNSDSELTVILNGVPNIESKLFDLRAEALLGTHRSSLVRVTYADPSADNSPLGVDGVFTVTDCDGGLHGVGFKGDYTLKQSVPNPATGTVRIEYALGLPGRASIDFFNAIGQHIQSLDLGEQTAGTHHITVDLSSLPAGRYTYRLQSLEYHADGTLLIVK
jgi:hypothetical protein